MISPGATLVAGSVAIFVLLRLDPLPLPVPGALTSVVDTKPELLPPPLSLLLSNKSAVALMVVGMLAVGRQLDDPVVGATMLVALADLDVVILAVALSMNPFAAAVSIALAVTPTSQYNHKEWGYETYFFVH